MTKIDGILYEALLIKGKADKDSLDALAKEARGADLPLANILLKHNIIPESDILNILSQELNLPYSDLKTVSIDKHVIEKIPLKIASYYKFLPLKINERTLNIAVAYPLDIKIQDEIRTQLGYNVDMTLASSVAILEGLKKYYGLAADTLEKISLQVPREPSEYVEVTHERVEDIEKLAGDASVIRLVNQIILEAWKKRSTDIHIEPYRGGVHLRYRIDGLLYDANVPPEIKNFLSAIISRIKIMSNLNIVERRLPQDGRAVVRVQEQVLDLRISTIPTPFGESVVIRILPSQMLFSLEKLGLGKRDLQVFENLIKKPHGILFITGPTGSGKTTTLYACLSRINTPERKIVTIEDPIEYEMAGITQIQVQSEIGLDFARGLRSILRHDPDVIMVGEVRDLETAEIAIRVALTGHLIFSTLHTNDAASGITRLIDIGVEPYLVASSIEAFIAQRLIRLICPHCKHEDKAAPVEIKSLIASELGLKSGDEIKVYRGKGCAHCNFTGFFGRTAIYEILLTDEEIKDLIVKKSPSNIIKKSAVSKGMHTLRQDGWQKVIAGLTTPEEVMKVTSLEEDKVREQVSGFETAAEKTAGFIQSEKRAYKRLDSRVNLRYKIFKSQAELIKYGFMPEQLSITKNISAGGLLFITSELLQVGSYIELKVEMPAGEGTVECLARVIRVEEIEEGRSYDTAVCFLDITSAQRAKLDKYVQTNLEKP